MFFLPCTCGGVSRKMRREQLGAALLFGKEVKKKLLSATPQSGDSDALGALYPYQAGNHAVGSGKLQGSSSHTPIHLEK